MVALVAVSADDQLVHGRASAERETAVHETKLRPLPQGAERPLEAGHVGGIDPDPVDLARGDVDERDRLRVTEDGPGETLALGTRKTLRVVQLLEKTPTRAGGEPLKVEEDPRGHDRAGQAGAPHLVDACDQTNATSAIVGKEGRVAHGVRLFKPTENPHPLAVRKARVRTGAPSVALRAKRNSPTGPGECFWQAIGAARWRRRGRDNKRSVELHGTR